MIQVNKQIYQIKHFFNVSKNVLKVNRQKYKIITKV